MREMWVACLNQFWVQIKCHYNLGFQRIGMRRGGAAIESGGVMTPPLLNLTPPLWKLDPNKTAA